MSRHWSNKFNLKINGNITKFLYQLQVVIRPPFWHSKRVETGNEFGVMIESEATRVQFLVLVTRSMMERNYVAAYNEKK